MENTLDTNVPVVKETSIGSDMAQSREQFEIQAQVVSAKKFPRDEHSAYTKAMKSFERPSLAEAAVYSFPRGGQTVTGPSVVCARELARCWGNMRTGTQIISSDGDAVHIRGYAFDLETNNRAESEARFSKRVQRKNKKTGVTEWVEADERDLRELVNKHGAIAVRNAILQLLPPDIIIDAVETAKDTERKRASKQLTQNKEDTIRALLRSYDDLGVSKEMIEAKLGHKLDLITEDEVVELRAVYRSISDGNSNRSEHFDLPKPSVGSDLNDKLKK